MKDISEFRALNIQRTKFIQSVTNNFKHSIEIINNNINMLMKNRNLGKNQEYLAEKISEQSKYIKHQVDQLLKIDRLNAGFELNKNEVMFDTLIESIENRLNPQIIQKSIKIIKSGVSEKIEVDKDLFEIALFNILENAVKYSHQKGEVFVSLSLDGVQTKIAIEDQGIGIVQIDIEKIFDPYYRVKDEEDDSMGVGLSIAKTIIEKHNGSLSVSSNLGKGSVFTITLPKS